MELLIKYLEDIDFLNTGDLFKNEIEAMPVSSETLKKLSKPELKGYNEFFVTENVSSESFEKPIISKIFNLDRIFTNEDGSTEIKSRFDILLILSDRKMEHINSDFVFEYERLKYSFDVSGLKLKKRKNKYSNLKISLIQTLDKINDKDPRVKKKILPDARNSTSQIFLEVIANSAKNQIQLLINDVSSILEGIEEEINAKKDIIIPSTSPSPYATVEQIRISTTKSEKKGEMDYDELIDNFEILNVKWKGISPDQVLRFFNHVTVSRSFDGTYDFLEKEGLLLMLNKMFSKDSFEKDKVPLIYEKRKFTQTISFFQNFLTHKDVKKIGFSKRQIAQWIEANFKFPEFETLNEKKIYNALEFNKIWRLYNF